MTFLAGQGVLGKIRFTDGEMPQYERPYLIVGAYSNYIEVVTVSSKKGKEQKLVYESNENLTHYDPPFQKPSFVKLDSLVRVPQCDWHKVRVLRKGKRLDDSELQKILRKIKMFN